MHLTFKIQIWSVHAFTGTEPMTLPSLVISSKFKYNIYSLLEAALRNFPSCKLFVASVEVKNLCVQTESRERTLRDRMSHTMCCIWSLTHSLTHIYSAQIWIYGPCTEVRFTPEGRQCTGGREAQTSERDDVTEQRYLLSMVPNHARKRLSSLHATDQPFTYRLTRTIYTPRCSATIDGVFLTWSVFSVNMRFYLWLCGTFISDSLERTGNNGWGGGIIVIYPHCTFTCLLDRNNINVPILILKGQVSPFTSHLNNHSWLHENCNKYYYFSFTPEIPEGKKAWLFLLFCCSVKLVDQKYLAG